MCNKVESCPYPYMTERPRTHYSPHEIAEIAQRVVEHIEGSETLSSRLAQTVTRALVSNPSIGAFLIEGLEDKFPQSVLSDEEIVRGLLKGYVVIHPYKKERVKTSSYDVSIGEYYWTTRPPHPGSRLFNPHNPDHIKRLWQGPFRAKTVREYLNFNGGEYCEEDFRGLLPDDPVIILAPGETILAHTEEFIGGRDKVTSMMKARSSWGRVFLSVCKDAGWGDVGFFNRWTMEVQNNLVHEWSVIPVRQPIAQMVFFRVNRSGDEQYSSDGSYQQTADLEKLVGGWKPEMMLPRLVRK